MWRKGKGDVTSNKTIKHCPCCQSGWTSGYRDFTLVKMLSRGSTREGGKVNFYDNHAHRQNYKNNYRPKNRRGYERKQKIEDMEYLLQLKKQILIMA